MIKNMKAGTLIYDLAAAQGGNSAFTEADKNKELRINSIKKDLFFIFLY